MNKPGIDIVIGVGKPKPPRPPAGMSGPSFPEELEYETPDRQKEEDSRMDRLERMVEKIAKALDIDVEGGDEEQGDEPDYGDEE